jgi:hypothetical protein
VDADKQLVHIPGTSGSLAFPRQDGFQLRKWGGAEKAGFQLIPNVIFQAQKHLGLDSVDIVILLNVTLHWWRRESLPYPSPAMIASRMGVSKRTVERRIRALERRQFLRRLPAEENGEGGPRVRRFVLDGLMERLETLAEVGVNRREFAKQRRKIEGQGDEEGKQRRHKN